MNSLRQPATSAINGQRIKPAPYNTDMLEKQKTTQSTTRRLVEKLLAMGWKIKNLESEAKPKNTREKQTTLRNIIIIPALTANRCKKKINYMSFCGNGYHFGILPCMF